MIKIKENYSLDDRTTFGVRATAEAWVEAGTTGELMEAVEAAKERGWPLHVLGGGSNVILMSRVPGLVLHPVFHGIRREAEKDGTLIVAGASEALDRLVRTSIEWGLGGLENLAAIPGTVAGAVVQNAGAYGLEIAERLAWCRALDTETGKERVFTTEECDFGYRSSFFKTEAGKRFIILEAAFRLPARWTPVIAYKELALAFGGKDSDAATPAAVEAKVREIRAAKLPDPRETGSAGSFFKNPVVAKLKARELITLHPSLVTYPLAGGRAKLAAGWLIDAAGLKGYAEEKVGIWPKHALILVNRGGAAGEDVLRFAHEVRDRVERRFGVELEPEPVIMGAGWDD